MAQIEHAPKVLDSVEIKGKICTTAGHCAAIVERKVY
jgi:hypothetical protein